MATLRTLNKDSQQWSMQPHIGGTAQHGQWCFHTDWKTINHGRRFNSITLFFFLGNILPSTIRLLMIRAPCAPQELTLLVFRGLDNKGVAREVQLRGDTPPSCPVRPLCPTTYSHQATTKLVVGGGGLVHICHGPLSGGKCLESDQLHRRGCRRWTGECVEASSFKCRRSIGTLVLFQSTTCRPLSER